MEKDQDGLFGLDKHAVVFCLYSAAYETASARQKTRLWPNAGRRRLTPLISIQTRPWRSCRPTDNSSWPFDSPMTAVGPHRQGKLGSSYPCPMDGLLLLSRQLTVSYGQESLGNGNNHCYRFTKAFPRSPVRYHQNFT